MKDFIDVMDSMIEVGFTDQDIVRLLRSCESQETAIGFAKFCIENKLLWNNIYQLNPEKTLVVSTSGGFIFNPRTKEKASVFMEEIIRNIHE